MQFFPILSTLRRHRTAAALIVLEIAFTCAIVCNALFLIRDRLSRMDYPSGLAEAELVHLNTTGIGQRDDAAAMTVQDLAALRALPGVKAVAATNMIPFGNSSWNSEASTKPDDPAGTSVATYLGTEDLVETLGVQLIAGRDFTPEEYVEFEAVQAQKARIPSIIITRGLAEKLFPGKSPLGEKLYVWGSEPQTVVGVIEHLARPKERDNARFAIVFPVNFTFQYMLRVEPARRAEVIAAIPKTIEKHDAGRIILQARSFSDIRNRFFREDRAMAWLLVSVTLALLLITALGVVGLASFWVQQRTRQIGIRRALGATRGDILRYFQTENFILATLGIILGMALAYAINLWLMDKYHVPRLPAEFLPIGALLLWLLGQTAVLGPAMRASMIPPAIATRTV